MTVNPIPSPSETSGKYAQLGEKIALLKIIPTKTSVRNTGVASLADRTEQHIHQVADEIFEQIKLSPGKETMNGLIVLISENVKNKIVKNKLIGEVFLLFCRDFQSSNPARKSAVTPEYAEENFKGLAERLSKLKKPSADIMNSSLIKSGTVTIDFMRKEYLSKMHAVAATRLMEGVLKPETVVEAYNDGNFLWDVMSRMADPEKQETTPIGEIIKRINSDVKDITKG
ncbi:MAG: hypothetical protein WCT36_05880 [Candidatus Gracilibacteria bacterium]|jgi:hypothetical protein